MENILNKKIELLPRELKPNQIHCSICSGIGWLRDIERGCISTCPHCSNGAIECCPECGKPYKTRYVYRCENQECRENYERKKKQEEFEKEMLAFEKAEKLEPNSIERFKMLFSELYNSNEGYFTEWDDFFASWESNVFDNNLTPQEELESRPKYVWGTSCTRISLGASLIIEQATGDLWEGASDNCDYKSLQEMLDKWCSEQSGTDTYWMDYKYAVRIPWEDYNR